MPQGYVADLYNIQGDGTALTNSTTATSLLAGLGKYTGGAGAIGVIGSQYLVKAAGRISTVATTPGTLTLDLRYGSGVVANGGAMTLSTTAKTNVSWTLEWLLTARAIGTSGNLMHQGIWTSEAAGATTVAGLAQSIMLPQSAPAVGTSADFSAANTWDLFGTWSVANPSNSIQVHQFSFFSLN